MAEERKEAAEERREMMAKLAEDKEKANENMMALVQQMQDDRQKVGDANYTSDIVKNIYFAK